MNRRRFIKKSLLATSVVPILGQKIFAATNSELYFGAPLTHSDWMLKADIAWGMEGVQHMLDVCKASGWSRVFWRAFDGGRSLYKSKLLRAQGKWDEDNFWNPKSDADKALLQQFTPNLTGEQRVALRNKFEAFNYNSFDSLEAAVKYGKKIGLQIHAWLTINEDDHGWGLQSEFSKKHPEFRWRGREGKTYHSQLSFAFPEVRKYKLALVEEILENYAVAGIFLDWVRTGDVRDNPQTDPKGVANSGYEEPLIQKFKKKFQEDPNQISNDDPRWVQMRAEPQTEFMRALRALVRSRKNNLPISVLVGHPWHYRGEQNKIDGNLRGLLLDVKAWANEGLMDSAVAAGYYRDGGNAEAAYRALQKETEGKVSVWTYAWVPQKVSDFQNDFALAQKLGAPQILFWEADYMDDRSNAAELKSALAQRARW
ncbi:MAG: family 10 glycosylhydrolase [Verrucomicrobiota bacterium]|nr:family 10 glycosylhydrolase [Verrucomicrobiota bacterium]